MRTRYALRTLLGVWLAPALVVIEVLKFVQDGAPWRGDLVWTLGWFAGPLWIAGPVAAGVAAVDAARLTRVGNLHLVVAVPGRSRALAWAALWCAVPLVVVHVIAVVTALAVGRIAQPATGWGSITLAVAVQALAIVWCVAMGSAVGRFLPPALAGLAAAVVGLFAFSALGDEGTGFGGRFAWLEMGAGGAPRVGWLLNPAFSAVQAAFLAIMIIGLLGLSVRERSGRVVPTGAALATVGVLLAGAVAAPHAPMLPGNLYLKDQAPPDQCSGEEPRVCTYPEHARLRADVVSKIDHLTRAATAAGYHELVPAEVHEHSRSYRPETYDPRGLRIPYEALNGSGLQWWDVAYELVDPNHCPQLEVGPPDEFWDDLRRLILTWLDLAVVPAGDVFFDPATDRLFTQEQAAEVIDRFGRCELAR